MSARPRSLGVRGRGAVLGTRVNFLVDHLGTWYCGACKPPSSSLKARGETPVLDIANYERTEFADAGTRIEDWPPGMLGVEEVGSRVEAAPATLFKGSAS